MPHTTFDPAGHRRRRAAAAGAALALAAALAGCAADGGGAERPAASGSPSASGTPGPRVRSDLESVFTDAGVNGTFVAYDSGTGEMTVVNPEEMDERVRPASTFKIPNSLISLQAGAVEDADEVVPYGGEPQRVDKWEHDMSMREAIRISALPIFQELARRVGHEDMASWVERFDYGNADIGGPERIDRFWLHGPLEISAAEQALFLDRMVAGDLPVDEAHVETLHSMVRQDIGDAEGRELYWKSGWADGPELMPGWMVGWVADGEDVTTFALRLEMESDSHADLREPMTRELLDELGVLPAESA
ncbi:penicillin-binding transpeptidase domain-containing protein [Streptomonospora nanhaiensis]|uniref:penicillin-binding transpeptidase domain-containing protein n=1 Tax=Streptomonospora nanhaiensis TaxID=1323731 RepID=UPI001C99CE9D|nr:penicillin-binding transpeptidase domain-containing protein [Streptomonospora nanhaiensis]MBX9388158.1 penicillin binding protein transpeptidase domain-containing protein [Streptomonospora nanhaiensis]